MIGQALRHGLGADLLHLSEIDTDALGSFCGAVPRRGSALQACIAKAELALAAGGTGLAIASEGSFGPHPAVPLLAVGIECLVFLDQERGLTIHEELVASRTNFAQRRLTAEESTGRDPLAGIGSWLGQVGFPRHRLLVRPADPEGTDPTPVIKGLADPLALRQAIQQMSEASGGGAVQLETDMRAHCNPTRMASIRRLAFQLVRRIATACPDCGTPGWGMIGSEAGLPCGWCGEPTELIRAEVLGCIRCALRRERPRPDGLRLADPQHCGHCNP